MQLEKIPRGRKHPRPIDADPVPEPHGAGHEYTQGRTAEGTHETAADARPESVGVPLQSAEPHTDEESASRALPAARTHVDSLTPPPGATGPAAHPAGPADEVAGAHGVSDWIGWKATDEMGRTAGRIEGAVDEEWLIVRDRRGRHRLAPATEAIAGGDVVFLPYEHDVIGSAPQLRGSGRLDPETAAAARSHYGGHNAAH